MKQYFIFYVMYSDIVCFVLFCSVSLKSCWLDLMNGLRTQLENRWIDRFVLNVIKDFPGSSAGEESTCQRRRRKKCGFDPCVRKMSWRREWLSTSVFLPGQSHGQKSLAGYIPWGHKESDTTEWLSTQLTWHPLLCRGWQTCQDRLCSDSLP